MNVYLAVFILAGSVLTSCKKDRTCSCTVTTTGTTTTHAQTAGNTINISPLPPIVITPATDTTYVTPYAFANTKKTSYDKVSKKAMHKNCPSADEESFSDQSTNITPGTSTITTIKSEKRVYSCSIE